MKRNRLSTIACFGACLAICALGFMDPVTAGGRGKGKDRGIGHHNPNGPKPPDTTPPTLDCPVEATVIGDICDQPVSIPKSLVEATDNQTKRPKISVEPTSLPCGETMLVTFTATDKAGNSATCDVLVTVECDLENGPRSKGFWSKQCTDESPLTQLLVMDTATYGPNRIVDDLCGDILGGNGPDSCDKARSQFASLLANLAAGFITEDCKISFPSLTSATTVGEAVDEMDQVLSPSPDDPSCGRINALADRINRGGWWIKGDFENL